MLLLLLLIPATAYPFVIKNVLPAGRTLTITLSHGNQTDRRVLSAGEIISFEPTEVGRKFLEQGDSFILKTDHDVNPDMSRKIDKNSIKTYFFFRDEGAGVCGSTTNLRTKGLPLAPIFDGRLTPQPMIEMTSAPTCQDPH